MIAAIAALFLSCPARAQLVAPESRATLGGEAVEVLRSAMGDGDSAVRAMAAQEWGSVGNGAVVPALRALLKDPDVHVRIAAAWSLHELGDRGGLSVLMKIAGDRIKRKKGSGPPNPLEELKRIARDKARVEAVRLLSQAESSGTTKLLEGLRSDPSGAVRDAAAAALARRGREAEMRQFIDALDSQDEAERLSAVRSLADIAVPAAVAFLRRMTVDPSIQVRVAAIQGLGAAGGAEALPDLQEGMKDGNELIRAASVEALGRLGGAEAEPLLKDAAAQGSNAYIRLLAARGLARMGREVDLGLAERSLDHKDADTRALVVEVLEASGGGDWALKLLETALKDSQPGVRVKAAAALVKLLQRKGGP